jgi:hypothetical protein
MESIYNLLKHLFVSAAATVGLVAPAPSPATPAFTQQTVVSTPPAVVETYTSTGEYSFLGQHVSYTISFPKNGGPVTGSFSGSCKGKINGHYAGGNGGEVRGNIDGKCKVAFIEQDARASYVGKVFPKDGVINTEYFGMLGGLSNAGFQQLHFTP